MLREPKMPKSPELIEAFYGRAWLLVHLLTFTPARNGQFTKYVTAINEGKSLAEAATVFGDLTQLQGEVDRYLAARQLKGTTIGAEAIKTGPVAVRALTLGEAALMPTRIQSTAGVGAKTAHSVFATACKSAAPFPNDAGAQVVLAEAALDAGEIDEATAAADRAIAADPKNVRAYLYRGFASAAALRARKGDVAAAEWASVRKWYSKANAIENDAPMPLFMFYRSYLDADRPPTESAKNALRRALELAPYAEDLRFATAVMWLHEKNAAEAAGTLKPLAYQPHGGDLAQLASLMLDAIAKNDLDAALKFGGPQKSDKAAPSDSGLGP